MVTLRSYLIVVLGLFVGRAVSAEPTDYEVKAAFLYNFAKFVEWPAEAFPAADSPLSLCVLGVDPFGAALDDAVAGKQVEGRNVKIRRIKSAIAPGGCHILFIAASEDQRVGQLLSGLRTEPVLTVSDVESFALRGGIIGLMATRHKVRFEINVVSARRAGLKLSSQLLKVATHIVGELESSP